MYDMKYLISSKGAVIFPPTILHKDVAATLGSIESAGFCAVGFNEQKRRFEVTAYGDSSSLGMLAKPETDKFKLEEFLNSGLGQVNAKEI
jgi:hypothetical protein